MDKVLEATPRSERGKKLAALRVSGVLPAVIYGKKEVSTPISLSRKAFEKLFHEAGESTILTLKGLGENKDVLIHDVERDPVTGNALHADFYAVESDVLIRVHVPIEFVGEAPVAKNGGAVLTKVLHEIEVECLPRNLPQHLNVDVSGLSEIGASVHVRDIVLPKDVNVTALPDDVVVVAQEVKEEVEAPVEAIDMSAIEVEKKGKTETEEASAE